MLVHFLQRTVFGPKVEWLARSEELSPWADPEYCVDWLWDTLPPYAPLPEYEPQLMVPEDLPEQQRLMREGKPLVLTGRILKPMVELDNPLRERVALFWHHHMPTGRGKTVEHGIHHWEIYRKHGMGNLRELLVKTLSSPAMMRFLDLRYSKKQDPNENFAREFMELHTLGEGHYTLEDIKEAAKALTGYAYRDKAPFPMVMDLSTHDEGDKIIFGQKGNFAAEDVVDLVLQRPQTSRHIAASALRFFFSDHPPQDMVEDCASAYLGSGYEMKALLDAIFRHELFLDPARYRSKVKTPIELLVGLQRQTGLRTIGLETDRYILSRFGQLIFFPPTVAGWPGGEQWLQGQRLLHRLFLPTALLDIANRSVPRSSLNFKITSRLYSAEKRDFRHEADARWNEKYYRGALALHGKLEAAWLLGEIESMAHTRDILQDPRYQYC